MIRLLFVLVSLISMEFAAVAQELNQFDAKGLKHGPWQGLFDESKRVRYEGQFEHGVEVGLFKYYDDTKAHPVIATREFSNKGKSAYTIFYDQQRNKVSEGNVVNRQYDGQWKYYHYRSPELMTLENYKSGKLEGVRKVFYKSGKIAEETTYANGIKHGPYRRYTETGILIEEANYSDGKFDGPAVYRDGIGNIVSKGNYKEGGKHGYWEFYENGKLAKKEKYPIRKPSKRLDKKPASGQAKQHLTDSEVKP